MPKEESGGVAVQSRKDLPFRILFLALAVIALWAIIASRGAPKPDSDYFASRTPIVKGEYTLVRDRPSEYQPDRVRMIVFFDFYCPNCRDFDSKVISELKEKYGERLEVLFVGYPIFGENAVNAIRAYELAKELDRGDEMKAAIFEAKHGQRLDIKDVAVLASLASSVGLEGDSFKKDLEQGAKNDVVDSNVRLAESYNVRQTPTVVLDGNMLVTETTFENMDEIISQLMRT